MICAVLRCVIIEIFIFITYIAVEPEPCFKPHDLLYCFYSSHLYLFYIYILHFAFNQSTHLLNYVLRCAI